MKNRTNVRPCIRLQRTNVTRKIEMLPLVHLHVLTALTPSPLYRSSLPGNVNFDPLGLSSINVFGVKDPDRILFLYRDAELKHARLAMLAAVAYPLQETINPLLSKRLDLPNTLPFERLSPSLLNGGLTPSILIFFLGLASGLELFKMNASSKLPGDYMWRITPHDSESQDFSNLLEGEIWNGRIAMIATLGYVVQELLTKMPVLAPFN